MNHTRKTWIGLLLVGTAALLIVGLAAVDPTLAQGGGTLSYGSRVYGVVGPETPPVTYGFPGAAGDQVNIHAQTWTGALDIRLDLIAPDGVILDSSSQNAPAGDPLGAVLEVALPQTGVYLLRLSGEGGTTGEFLLTLLGHASAEATPLIFGEAVEVTVAQNAAPQMFSFEAEHCPTTLVVSDPSEGLPYTFPFVVKVRDQRGQTVARLRGGDQLEDRVTVQPDSGRYDVEVLAADPALAGTIRLLVTCSGEAPGCAESLAGAQGGSGAVPASSVCVPCPRPGDLVPGGGCPALNLVATPANMDMSVVTVTWDAMAGAEGYTVWVRGLTPGGTVYVTHSVWVPGNPLSFTWDLPDEGYTGYQFTLEVWAGGAMICTQQAESRLPIGQEGDEPDEPGTPCAIIADALDVLMRVGPGLDRGVLDFLPAGVEIPVIGQATDGDGIAWWQIDKSVIPGSGGVISLWVPQSEVDPVGDCSNIPEGDIPPIIPGGDEPPGVWLPCGSCDTCGHPAGECVTSPEGQCLWDPATCTSPPPPGDGDEPPPPTACVSVSVAVNLGRCLFTSASAMLDTPPNCAGGGVNPGILHTYTSGTLVNAHAVAVDPKCNVESWSGCGASGTENSISITATSDCTLTANMYPGN